MQEVIRRLIEVVFGGRGTRHDETCASLCLICAWVSSRKRETLFYGDLVLPPLL